LKGISNTKENPLCS